jgi:hypothetical protein
MQGIYGSGTPYVLTTESKLTEFGTTTPQVTIRSGETYAISARALVDMFTCVTDDPITITLKLRAMKTGVSVDIANSETTLVLGTIGGSGQNEVDQVIDLPPVIYTAAEDALIVLYASIDVLPDTGDLSIREASILVQ